MHLYEEVSRLHRWKGYFEVLNDLDSTCLVDTDGFDFRRIGHEYSEPFSLVLVVDIYSQDSEHRDSEWRESVRVVVRHPSHNTMHAVARSSLRHLSSISSSVSSRVPWFIDSSEALLTPQRASSQRGMLHPLPPGVPLVLQNLHAQLVQSPYLEPSELLVRDPIPQPPGPPLPMSTLKGRRKRGSTYAGEGFLEPGGIWSWIMLAQVQS
jgi:hypothetical protein